MADTDIGLPNQLRLIRPAIFAYFQAVGEKGEKAKEFQEVLKIVEEQGLGDQKFFASDNTIGSVDIAFGMLAYWLECIEKVVGVKILEASNLPRSHACAQNFKQVPVVNDNLHDGGKLLAHYKHSKEKLILAEIVFFHTDY
ncbi:glutathione S-transferase U8-like [Rosa rugosa]|uniref:glutathione S-transferase U8-like n=1 Tax=Rosa rugosa TaxID=74645 RepID=UPI002B40C053|nr:glutathione S-transferase U8-like [Rosa rugosa]